MADRPHDVSACGVQQGQPSGILPSRDGVLVTGCPPGRDAGHVPAGPAARTMIKLGARDRAQLVVFAFRAGLVIPRAAG